MTNYQIITVENDIYFSDAYLELKRKRQLSKTINNLLRAKMSVKASEIPSNELEIEDALRENAARKALLMERKQSIEKEKQKKKTRSPKEIYEQHRLVGE
jgi:uncharacterized protein YlxP (DUF503 family)